MNHHHHPSPQPSPSRGEGECCAARPWRTVLREAVREELVEHLPYTLWGVAAGVLLVSVCVLWLHPALNEKDFHISHFLHIFFSAGAGAMMIRRLSADVGRLMVIPMITAVILCSMSDVVVPYWGARLLLHKSVLWNLCLVEHPQYVLTSAFLGGVSGTFLMQSVRHGRWYHLLHLTIAVSASALYLLSFVSGITFSDGLGIGLILLTAILLPCLLSDVVVPLSLAHWLER